MGMNISRQTVNAILCAILETLDEAAPMGEAPESVLWLGVESLLGDLLAFRSVLALAEQGGLLVTDGNSRVIITPKGREMVACICRARREGRCA